MAKLLTVSDVGLMLNLHQNTIYNWIKQGRIPFIKVNGKLRFRLEDLYSWLDERTYSKFVIENLLPKLDLSLEEYDRMFLKGDSALSKNSKRWNYGIGVVYLRTYKSGLTKYGIEYFDRAGKRVRKILPDVQSRAEALIVLQKRIVEKFDSSHRTNRRGKVKFKEFAKIYLEDYAIPNKRSWKTDEYRLNKLLEYFGEIELDVISPQDVEKFRAERIRERAALSTTNRFLALIKRMFSLAVEWGYARENPVTKVKMHSESDNLVENILDAEKEEELLKSAEDWLRPIITVALYTGMRRSEILKLMWKDIDFEKKMIKVWGKGGKFRAIPMNGLVCNMLQSQQKKDQKVFPYNFRTVRTYFEHARSEAGIKLRFHDLRHTFATRLIESGADIVTVQQLLGHHSVVVTQRYTHSNLENKRRAVENLSRICHSGDPRCVELSLKSVS